MKCYVCGDESPGQCEEFEPGELTNCPEGRSVGCLIQKLTVGDVSGPGKYTRSCTDSHAFPCRDYQGDGPDEVTTVKLLQPN